MPVNPFAVADSLGALNDAVVADVTDASSAIFSVKGTYVATVAFEVSDDGGTTPSFTITNAQVAYMN